VHSLLWAFYLSLFCAYVLGAASWPIIVRLFKKMRRPKRSRMNKYFAD
jgi:hypothetical protein